jgi:hypothetical protein
MSIIGHAAQRLPDHRIHQRGKDMRSHLAKLLPIACSTFVLCGCVALKSVKHPTEGNNAPHGIGYYLPNGHIKVSMTVTKDDEGIITRSFSVATLYYPDTGRRYSIQFPKNLVADSDINIGVSMAGLLNSASYTYQPKIIEAIQSLPPKVGVATASASPPPPPKEPCTAPGIYSTSLDPSKEREGQLCGFKIVVDALSAGTMEIQPSAQEDKKNQKGNETPEKPQNGIFFRMNRPYLIKLEKDGTVLFSDIALSPTQSKTQFLKLNRSLFARNNGTITFHNGVLTGYAPNMDSEIESGFKLPATIIKAYFDSVSALFTFRTGRTNQEAGFLAAVENFNRAQASLEACEAAFRSGDQTQIDANCTAASSKP